MNYTENYHLPQWVKTDRIMMEDFNAAMSNIENGLAGNAQSADAFHQHSDAQDKVLMDRMLRLAYNQFLAARTFDPFPEQIGAFYQHGIRDLTIENAGGTWEGARFVGTGTGGFNVETFFRQYAKTVSSFKLDKNNPANNTPLMVEICTPAATRVEKFILRGNFSNNVPNTPAQALLTVNNLDTGEVEQSFQLDLTQKEVSGSPVIDLQSVILYFHGGTHYLLKMEPVGNPVFNCNLTEFTYGTGTQVQGAGGGLTRFDLSYVIREREGSSLGLLILRCKAGGPDGRLTVQWDGKTVTPDYVYPCRNDQGLSLREMIYVRRGNIPAETKFSVRFDCGENGSLWFQDWGAILL